MPYPDKASVPIGQNRYIKRATSIFTEQAKRMSLEQRAEEVRYIHSPLIPLAMAVIQTYSLAHLLFLFLVWNVERV